MEMERNTTVTNRERETNDTKIGREMEMEMEGGDVPA